MHLFNIHCWNNCLSLTLGPVGHYSHQVIQLQDQPRNPHWFHLVIFQGHRWATGLWLFSYPSGLQRGKATIYQCNQGSCEGTTPWAKHWGYWEGDLQILLAWCYYMSDWGLVQRTTRFGFFGQCLPQKVQLDGQLGDTGVLNPNQEKLYFSRTSGTQKSLEWKWRAQSWKSS